MGLIEGTTTYDAFGDVDFVIEAAPEKMEIKQAVYAELDEVTPGHAILASNTSVALDHRDGRRDAAPREGRRLPLLLPGLGDAAGRDHRGRGHHPEVVQAAFNFAQAIRKQPITCARGPRLRRQPDPELGGRRDLARAGGAGPLDQEDRRGGRGGRTSRRWARSSWSTCSVSTPSSTSPSTCSESYGDSFYVHKGMQKLVADGKLGAKTGGEGFYKDGEPNIPGDGEPDGEALAELLTAEGARRGLPAARGGRLRRSARSTSG